METSRFDINLMLMRACNIAFLVAADVEGIKTVPCAIFKGTDDDIMSDKDLDEVGWDVLLGLLLRDKESNSECESIDVNRLRGS